MKCIKSARKTMAQSEIIPKALLIFRYPTNTNGKFRPSKIRLMLKCVNSWSKMEIPVTPPSRKWLGIINPLSATPAQSTPNIKNTMALKVRILCSLSAVPWVKLFDLKWSYRSTKIRALMGWKSKHDVKYDFKHLCTEESVIHEICRIYIRLSGYSSINSCKRLSLFWPLVSLE